MLAASAALTGCATSAPASSGFSIVATTTHVADFTRAIAGDEADVAQLLQPGQSAHSLDLVVLDLTALATADVLVINGAGLEGWIDDAVEASGFDGTIIDASTDVHLLYGGDHDHDGGGDHGHDEHHNHSADATDPHVWSDPRQVMHMVETITRGLPYADAASADAYRANANAYIEKLESLDTWVTESIAQVPEDDRLLVTTHDTFAYLAQAQHITVVGNVFASRDDNAEPSAAELDALIAKIRATGTRAVFSETSINPALAEAIARDAGVKVYSGEDALYADALGPEGSSGATYIDIQMHNVTQLTRAWGAEPVEVPETLLQS